MRDILDYRKWFEFRLEYQKTGEVKKELTDRAFFTFSGGEKAMSMYVPLFSAAVAKYKGAREDARESFRWMRPLRVWMRPTFAICSA